MPDPLSDFPPFSDRTSFLYLEHGSVERENDSVSFFHERTRTPIPAATLGLLLLGPGTTVTHEAVKVLAHCGCGVAWTGEEGVRFYAGGFGSGSAALLMRQAMLHADPDRRLATAKRLYALRFGSAPELARTFDELRSHEARRVREAYRSIAELTGVVWQGRQTDLPWEAQDPANRALSTAHAALYGLAQAAVHSLGLAPGLGFLHSGDALAFVYDLADVYKLELAPVPFGEAAKALPDLESRVRRAMRDRFRTSRLLSRMASDAAALFGGEA